MGNWMYIMCLENCQRKLTLKRIEGFGSLSYQERLSKLSLTTLLERRGKGDLIETFKIVLRFALTTCFASQDRKATYCSYHSERLPKVMTFLLTDCN